MILEAFAGATPVIAVKATGVEDLVEDGVNGILTGENTEEYAEKLVQFLRSVPERTVEGEGRKNPMFQAMAENAFRTGMQYREEMVAFNALHYYNSIIEQKRAVEGQRKRTIHLLPRRV